MSLVVETGEGAELFEGGVEEREDRGGLRGLRVVDRVRRARQHGAEPFVVVPLAAAFELGEVVDLAGPEACGRGANAT